MAPERKAYLDSLIPNLKTRNLLKGRNPEFLIGIESNGYVHFYLDDAEKVIRIAPVDKLIGQAAGHIGSVSYATVDIQKVLLSLIQAGCKVLISWGPEGRIAKCETLSQPWYRLLVFALVLFS